MPAFFLDGFTTWWSSCYSNHHSVSVLVRYLHLVGLILAGGTGLFADRQILRAARSGPEQRETALAGLHSVHRHVISSVIVIAFTGVLMTAADSETFLVSRLYWVKMGLVALLIANGAVMLMVERRARRGGAGAAWPGMVAVSAASAVLWLTVLFMGTLLTVAA